MPIIPQKSWKRKEEKEERKKNKESNEGQRSLSVSDIIMYGMAVAI